MNQQNFKIELIKNKKNELATKIYNYFFNNFKNIEDDEGKKFIDKINFNEHKKFYEYLCNNYDIQQEFNLNSYNDIYMKFFLEQIYLFENYKIELYEIKKSSDCILKMYNESYTILIYNFNCYPNGYKPKYKIKFIDNITNEEICWLYNNHVSIRMFYDSIYEKIVDMIFSAVEDKF